MLPTSADAVISAILPVRNEERVIARAVQSLARQPEIGEVVVVNDESSDGTAIELAKLSAGEPKLKVFDAGALPPGWIGKNHAAWIGAQHATGHWLLFTDADAVHLPGSAARALADADAYNATLLSYSPGQEMLSWSERVLIPFVFCRLGQLYSYATVNDPDSPAAAANGQYILIRRDIYDAIGGHAAVAGDVLEDVALARRAKSAGVRLHFASNPEIARVRMYPNFAAMWEGWTKNLFPLVTGSGQTVTRELLAVIPWIPLLCLALAPIHVVFAALALLLLAGRHASYAATLRRNNFPMRIACNYLPAVVLYSLVMLSSDWRYARGIIVWKGREYPVNTSGT